MTAKDTSSRRVTPLRLQVRELSLHRTKNPANPCIHSKGQIRKLARSVFGSLIPITIVEADGVLTGAGWLQPGRDLGYPRCQRFRISTSARTTRKLSQSPTTNSRLSREWNDPVLSEQLKALSVAKIDFESEIDLHIQSSDLDSRTRRILPSGTPPNQLTRTYHRPLMLTFDG